jgi:sugar phosphate isomerase/epimerase
VDNGSDGHDAAPGRAPDGTVAGLDRRSFIGIVSGSLLSAALGTKAYGMRTNGMRTNGMRETGMRTNGIRAARKLDRIGVQLYTIRDALTKDLDGSLARVAKIGFQEVELAGYRSHSVAEFKTALDRHGLSAPSTHIAFERIRDELPAVLDEAHTLGHKYVVCPNIADAKSGLDGYRKAADVLNNAGMIAKKSGITIGYHNHESELTPINGQRPYDVLLERTDPSLVVMEMDIYWMEAGGGDPITYFRKYPGRYRMVHAKGMEAGPKHGMTDVGKGVIDWKGIFAANPGIEHYFVEHDHPADPFASIAASYEYLKGLEF